MVGGAKACTKSVGLSPKSFKSLFENENNKLQDIYVLLSCLTKITSQKQQTVLISVCKQVQGPNN